jgi:hypothetical protein
VECCATLQRKGLSRTRRLWRDYRWGVRRLLDTNFYHASLYNASIDAALAERNHEAPDSVLATMEALQARCIKKRRHIPLSETVGQVIK